jgi:hypothetical protein
MIREASASGELLCEECRRALKINTSYVRKIKESGESLTIRVLRCTCGAKGHALLPDFLLPHKHYSANEIESVIIDAKDTAVSDIETEASEATIRRWLTQIGERITGAVSVIKAIFIKIGDAVSEIHCGEAECGYDELEILLGYARRRLKSSGNKLGLANLWLEFGGGCHRI